MYVNVLKKDAKMVKSGFLELCPSGNKLEHGRFPLEIRKHFLSESDGALTLCSDLTPAISPALHRPSLTPSPAASGRELEV